MKLLKTQEMAEMTEFYPCFLTSKLPQLFRGHQFTPGLLIWANAGRCTCHLTVVLLLSSPCTCPENNLHFVGLNYLKPLARQGSTTLLVIDKKCFWIFMFRDLKFKDDPQLIQCGDKNYDDKNSKCAHVRAHVVQHLTKICVMMLYLAIVFLLNRNKKFLKKLSLKSSDDQL